MGCGWKDDALLRLYRTEIRQISFKCFSDENRHSKDSPFLAALFAAGEAAAQQQPLYAQYQYNGMVINPGYPSMDEFGSATVVMRNQWVGMEGAPKTATFSFYSPIKSTGTSVGFMALKDEITIYSQTGYHLNISQKVKLDDKLYLAMGLKGGMEQYRENNDHLGSPDDPVFSNNQSYWKTDVGFGFVLFQTNGLLAFLPPLSIILTWVDL